MRPFLRLFNALKANGESHTAALLGREDPHRTRRLGRKAVGLARLQRYRLRKILREDIFALVLAAACVGAASGIISSLMVSLSEILHRYLFALAQGSNSIVQVTHLSSVNTLLVLAAGGLVVGTTYRYQSGRRHLIVDPIEADASHGGRMSLADSVFLAVQSFISCGFGLSLGIEGGFTQAAGAVGSKAGQLLNRRRHDVRMLVGAGAAGGIAGAFGAPFAGAASGFDLIVGSYTVANLAPIVAASVSGTLSARALIGHTYHIPLDAFDVGQDGHAVSAIVLGILCGLLSVVLMRGVTTTESLFYRSGLRTTWRPVAGSIRGLIAIFIPHILGSGHQATALVLHGGLPLRLLAAVLAAKIVASALSIGTGFRGGLFSHIVVSRCSNRGPRRPSWCQLRFPYSRRCCHDEPCGHGKLQRSSGWSPDDDGLVGSGGDGRFSRGRASVVRCSRSCPHRPPGVRLFVLPYGVFICAARPSSAAKILDELDK